MEKKYECEDCHDTGWCNQDGPGWGSGENLPCDCRKKKAAGIVSYLASPLDIQKQYKLETGNDAMYQISDGLITDVGYNSGFVLWLMERLTKLAAR